MKRMKEQVQKAAIFIAKESVGKSVPLWAYEVKIPDVLQNAELEKMLLKKNSIKKQNTV